MVSILGRLNKVFVEKLFNRPNAKIQELTNLGWLNKMHG